MNAEQRDAALTLAGKGVQVDDGHTYGVLAADLVAYSETIRALVAELDRVALVRSRVEDVRCAACMTGSVDPVTGVPRPPAGHVREAVLLQVMEAIERWADLLPTPEVSGFVTDYLLREFEVRPRGAAVCEVGS